MSTASPPRPRRAPAPQPVRRRPRAWDTILVVVTTMVAMMSWQLTSDPGLGGMLLDALCDGNRECRADMEGARVAVRGLRSADLDRLFELKSEPGVADYQLYGKYSAAIALVVLSGPADGASLTPDPPRGIVETHGNFLFPYIGAQLRKSLIPRALMLPWYNRETRMRRVFAVAEKADKDRELVGIVGVYGYYDRKRKTKEIHYELHPSVWRRGGVGPWEAEDSCRLDHS